MTQPIAGWYPDPSDPSRQRYFDGKAWTENYAPFGAPAPGITHPGIGQPAKAGMSRGMKIVLGVGAAVLALVAIGNIGSSDKSDETSSRSTASLSESSASTAKRSSAKPVADADVPASAGSSVRDGKFEFKVLGVERGATSKDGGFGTTDTAKGEYFTVKLQVTNIGDDARTLFASNQKLIINGNKYEATSHITDDGWKEDINPGLGSTTTATFDIPPGAVPTAIECHDSAFSGGALLAL